MAKPPRFRSGPSPMLLVPMWLLFTLLLTVGLGGCGPLVLTPDQQQSVAAERIRIAVQAEEGGDHRLADAAAADAVRVSGNDSSQVAWVAQELTRAGRPHIALRLLGKATRTPAFNDDPNIYLQLALAQEQVGDHGGVKLSLEEAVRRAESLRSATNETKETRAANLLKAGNFWASVENPHADTVRALDALRAAHALLPNHPTVQNALGYTLADRGTTKAQWAEALNLTRQAAEQLPEDGNVLDSLGWALYRTGDIAEARRVLRHAADREGDSPEVRCHLGIVFAKSRHYRDAAIELRRALQLWPRYEEAERALKALPPDVLETPTPTPTPAPLNAPVSAPNAAPRASTPSASPTSS